jgi:16S rRNA (cytidine1402-2'-O)-methyltransferase
MLRDLMATMGDRRVALCRELTKLHEEVRRGTAAEVLGSLEDDPLRGEVVVVVEGDRDGVPVDMPAAIAAARALVADGMRKRDAAHAVADRLRISANEVYRALLDADVP